MCIILYVEQGKTVKDEWLDNSAQSNKDGFGLSYSNGGRVNIFKTMDYKEFKEKYRELESNFPEASFILHFRKSTAGKINVDNCHPFLVDNKAVFHNGSIALCKPPSVDKERSDTRIFCEDILNGLPNKWVEFDNMLDLIEGYIGDRSKMLFMEEDGTVSILNEVGGHWVDGIWASNYSYYPNTKSVQKNKPFSWNSNVKLIGGSSKVIEINTKKGKDHGKKRFLPVCYKHPGGEFTKYKDNRRFRWFPGMFMWAAIDTNGKTNYKNPLAEYSDPPSSQNYKIIEAGYGLTGPPAKENIVGKDVFECDWCGGLHERSEYSIYSWREEYLAPEDDPEEKHLVCESCINDLGISDIMVEEKNVNFEYWLNTRIASRLWDVV